ncbi:MAG: gliding motility-associated C-terminal domain-containing protein [Flavobacteriia bacterium]|nr:gliding motility-associated C-terminal domain-containing protein [Flavobacteriia bacterium]OJX36119.1 MAG: hypothetical protein BGO87_06545 [Flavobacteriia bacterium 40-80]
MKFLAQIIVVVLLFNTSHSFSQTLRLTNNVQYVQIGDMDVPGNQITVECLVKRTGGTNILSKHTGPSNVNYLMRIGTFELTTANGFYLMNNPYAGSMSTTSWYHVAGTYDGSNIRYYVNGCLVVQQAATGNLTQNNLIAAIGNISTAPNAEQFYGEIDELRIWNVARSATDLQNNMFDIPNPTTQANLVAYYKFNGNVNNIQGNATYNGTWVGTADYGSVEPTAADIHILSLNNVSKTDLSCYNSNNGSITITANGSNLSYSINNTNWVASNQFSNLSAGNYTAYVRSAEGCILSQTITVDQAELLQVTASNNGPVCQGQSAQVTATTSNTGVTYNWTGPNGFTGNQDTHSVTATGTYQVTISKNGCNSQPSATTMTIAPSPQITANVTPLNCHNDTNGSISVTTNVPGSTIVFTNTNDTTSVLNNLPAGTYTIEAISPNGCISNTSVTITNPDYFEWETVITPTNCYDPTGKIEVIYHTNHPLTITWADDNTAGPVRDNLNQGTYNFTVSNNNGCTISGQAAVPFDNNLNLSANHPSVTLNEGSSAALNVTMTPYVAQTAYEWIPDYNISCNNCPNPTITPMVDTTYIFIATAPNGCKDTLQIPVKIILNCGEEPVFVPNMFSPNGDGINDIFAPRGRCILSYNLKVYNRWGELVYRQDGSDGWDGTFNEKKVSTGVYIYYLEASLLYGETVIKNGSVTLTR